MGGRDDFRVELGQVDVLYLALLVVEVLRACGDPTMSAKSPVTTFRSSRAAYGASAALRCAQKRASRAAGCAGGAEGGDRTLRRHGRVTARAEHFDPEDVRAVLAPFYACLRLAKEVLAEESRAEADAELRQALAFYRSVGATRFIREGEALLAETA